jgi:acetolactate synthase small subunit
VARCKIKSVAFLYTNDKWAEKENKKTIPFTIVTNNMKYLGVTLTKQVKDLNDRLKVSHERNRRSQKMERTLMLMDL